MVDQLVGILLDLGLNKTIFIQAGIFIGFYLVARAIYFGPFLALIEDRRRQTLEDRRAAEQLLSDAQTKVDEYEARISKARAAARADYERIIADARKEESALLLKAREDAKEITQSTLDQVAKQREELRRALRADTDAIADEVTRKLLNS